MDKSSNQKRDLEEGELSESGSELSAKIVVSSDVSDDETFRFTDKEILNKIPRKELKRLKLLSETEREKQILKLIDEFDAKQRRKELKKRIKDNYYRDSESSNGPTKKSSKWHTEKDLADLEHVNEKRNSSKSYNSFKNFKSDAVAKIETHKDFEKEKKSKKLHSPDKKNHSKIVKSKYIETLDDLLKMRLSRAKIVKSLFMPYFDKFVKNSFVRVNLGGKDTSSTGYQICRVTSSDTNSTSYSVDDKETDQTLHLETASGAKRVIKLIYLSNSPILNEEFITYTTNRNLAGLKMPLLSEISKKVKDISEAIHYKLTEAEIKQIVEKKSKFRKQPHKFAKTKSEILENIEAAQINNNTSDLELWTNELKKIEKHCEKHINEQNQYASALININKRNRKQNINVALEYSANESADSNTSMHSGNSYDQSKNPYKRQKGRLNLVGKIAKDSLLKSDLSVEINDSNTVETDNSITSNKKITDSINFTKKKSTNEEISALHDFEVNIDISNI